MDIGRLVASLGLDNKEFMKGMSEAEQRMNSASQQMMNSFSKVGDQMQASGRKMQSAGKSMSLALTLPLSSAGGLMMKTAADFEKGMNQVAAVSGATSSELEQLEDIAREMGATTKFSAVEAAGALNFLAMAGFEVQEAITALPSTLKLASAGNMELAESADIVSNVMQGFGLRADQTEETVDILSKAFTSSNTSLSQLGEAMSYAAPVARAFGQDITTATAAVGFLSDAGIQSTRAGTGLSQSLLQLSKQSEKLGLDIKDASGNLIPLADILEEVEKSGLSTGVMIEALGARAGPAFATLMERGSVALREFEKELDNSGGTAEEIADIQMQGLSGAMTELTSALSELAIAFMQEILPVLTGFIDRLKGAVDWLSSLDSEIRKWIVILGAALAALGPLLIIVGQLVIAMGAITKAFAASTIALNVLTTAKIAATKAMWALNAAFRANPIGVVLTAVLALGTAMYALSRNTENQTKAQKALSDAESTANAQFAEQASHIERLRWTVENSNISLENRRKALSELQQIVPAYNASLTEEGNLINNNTSALEGYLVQLREKIRYQAFETELTKHIQAQEQARQHLIDTEVRWYELVEKNRRKQLSAGETREFKALRDARNESNLTINETTKAIDALTLSQERYQRQLRETQLNDFLSNLETMGDKVDGLSRDQLQEFKNMMEHELPGAIWFAENAISELDEEASRLRVSQLEAGLDAVTEALKELSSTTDDGTDSVNKLKNAIVEIETPDLGVGEGLFDDIIDEFAYVNNLLEGLENSFTSLEMKGTIIEDFDVLDAKIRVTERAIEDMVNKIASGEMDATFLPLLTEQYDELISQVEKTSEVLGNQYGVFDSYNSNLENLKDSIIDWEGVTTSAVQSIVDAFFNMAEGIEVSVKDIIKSLLRMIVTQLISSAISAIFNPAAGASSLGNIGGFIPNAKVLSGGLNLEIPNNIPGMAEGGQVPMGFPGDTYPALLTSGETVLPPEDLDKLLSQMKVSINTVAENAITQMRVVMGVPRMDIVHHETAKSIEQQNNNDANKIQIYGKLEGETIALSNDRFRDRFNLVE